MQTITQAKAQAKRLRAALAKRDIDLPHTTTLELIAEGLGFKDWNTAAASLDPGHATDIVFEKTIPILRIFDEGKAREFYCDFLGFSVVFEHRFAADLPLYLGIGRADVQLHLSEHHGDASPGATVFVPMRGIARFHAELTAKRYNYGRPGLEAQPWGEQVEVHDPFGNRLRFCQQSA
ncbi:glyoxalase superfamily protein [Aestuariivita sp.]|jgi:catechol 2,3-dioxygenase-like lactoylglutathione lyase family enzyme|uniref:glyoxalase superfamily protein n=1 Tax=Aestuariivita sp. TaxID=1872407 RepID=UPI00216E3D07|nr:VOC family protein [Aestuariivita sp.]